MTIRLRRKGDHEAGWKHEDGCWRGLGTMRLEGAMRFEGASIGDREIGDSGRPETTKLEGTWYHEAGRDYKI